MKFLMNVKLPFSHFWGCMFHDLNATTQAKVLRIRSWAMNNWASPQEPSCSWLFAIHSRQEGNWGEFVSPTFFFTRPTHAVSYADTVISPSSFESNINFTIFIFFCISYKNVYKSISDVKMWYMQIKWRKKHTSSTLSSFQILPWDTSVTISAK